MSIIDSFLTNSDSILAGLKVVRGIGDYIIVKKGNEVICYTYQGDTGEAIIKVFLKNHNIDESTVTYEKKRFENKDEELLLMRDLKLCLLDKEVVLYKKVVEQSNRYKIKGYKEGKLANQFNIFKTIADK